MGPMFSGKTEMLINKYNAYTIISEPHKLYYQQQFVWHLIIIKILDMEKT